MAMVVISGKEARRRIYDESDPDRQLVITPLLEPDSQIKEDSSSIDLRLGCHFLQQRRSNVSFIDAGRSDSMENYRSMERREFVPLGGYLVLHPKQFVLGSTLEYVAMPLDLSGYVVGRSSWGRLGLVVATAIGVHPGYKGIIVLELSNVGEVPFYLRPGLSIAQLFLHSLEDVVTASGLSSSYIGAVLPEPSQIGQDVDLEVLRGSGEDLRQPDDA